MRLAKMVGRRAVAARRPAGSIPGLAIAFNAVGNERDTRALADRAIALLRRLSVRRAFAVCTAAPGSAGEGAGPVAACRPIRRRAAHLDLDVTGAA